MNRTVKAQLVSPLQPLFSNKKTKNIMPLFPFCVLFLQVSTDAKGWDEFKIMILNDFLRI